MPTGCGGVLLSLAAFVAKQHFFTCFVPGHGIAACGMRFLWLIRRCHAHAWHLEGGENSA